MRYIQQPGDARSKAPHPIMIDLIKNHRRTIAALSVFCMLFAIANFAMNVRFIISDFEHGNTRAKTQSAEKTVLHLSTPPPRIHHASSISFCVILRWHDSPVMTTHLDFSLYNRPPPLV